MAVKLYFKGECTKFLNLTDEVLEQNAPAKEEDDAGWYDDAETPPPEEEASALPFDNDDDIF